MAIRIRKIDGTVIAICAAISVEKEGDIYLDDNAHHALSTKFGLDWHSEGLLDKALADTILIPYILTEQGGMLT